MCSLVTYDCAYVMYDYVRPGKQKWVDTKYLSYFTDDQSWGKGKTTNKPFIASIFDKQKQLEAIINANQSEINDSLAQQKQLSYRRKIARWTAKMNVSFIVHYIA